MSHRDQIFVSYSHRDKVHLNRLQVHFRPFERDYSIQVWSDEKIQSGQLWRKEIETALKQTAVAILLISADFLASDFIANEELPRLLDAAQSEGVTILCFIVSPCSFMATKLAKYQTVNNPAKPLVSFNKQSQRDALWVDLVQQATRALDRFKAQETAEEALEKDIASPKSSIGWSKAATLFWLGNDLMWIQDMTYRGAEPKRVLQGVENAIHYAEELGFASDSLPIKDLMEIRRNLELLAVRTYLDPEHLTDELYEVVRQGIETIKWYIHGLAKETQQPDFEKLRAL